jgi:hypothetical protein
MGPAVLYSSCPESRLCSFLMSQRSNNGDLGGLICKIPSAACSQAEHGRRRPRGWSHQPWITLHMPTCHARWQVYVPKGTWQCRLIISESYKKPFGGYSTPSILKDRSAIYIAQKMSGRDQQATCTTQDQRGYLAQDIGRWKLRLVGRRSRAWPCLDTRQAIARCWQGCKLQTIIILLSHRWSDSETMKRT